MSWIIHVEVPSLFRGTLGPFATEKKAKAEAEALKDKGGKVFKKVMGTISKKDAKLLQENGFKIDITKDGKRCSPRSWKVIMMAFAPEFLA